jgi:predicted Zn-dependent protease with MMP-like domain
MKLKDSKLHNSLWDTGIDRDNQIGDQMDTIAGYSLCNLWNRIHRRLVDQISLQLYHEISS